MLDPHVIVVGTFLTAFVVLFSDRLPVGGAFLAISGALFIVTGLTPMILTRNGTKGSWRYVIVNELVAAAFAAGVAAYIMMFISN
jgi:hypothetical protein